MEVKGRKVLVFGAGISGIGAAGLLEANGADVILYDGNEKLDPASLKEQLGEKSGAAVLTGKLPQETITSLDMAVLSPGVPTDLPVVLAMKEAGVQVIGEIELAYQFGKGDVLAITGTNGKTTTTSLLGQIMKQAREEVYVVGNIGNRGRDQQLPAGDHPGIPPESQRDPEYHAGSSEPASYDGGLYRGEGKYRRKSDRR